jgi:putative methyltransferase (TIGR04325 family)
MKSFIKQISPPAVLNTYRRLKGGEVRFKGSFSTWQEALQYASGYQEEHILEKVREATRIVIQGNAACERDSALFDRAQYPFPLIATLLRAALENSGKLTVLDFGGALGSSYYQCRDYIECIHPLRWCIVEQDKFTELGRREFQNDIIRFYDSVEQCSAAQCPQVVLFSSVLQYLNNPFTILESVDRIGVDYIVIDRTPFTISGKRIITVQVVPDKLVRSSYPAWLFNEQDIRDVLANSYEEIATFDAVDGEIGYGQKKAKFKGIIFRRKR